MHQNSEPMRCAGVVGGVRRWLFDASVKDKLTLFVSKQDNKTVNHLVITVRLGRRCSGQLHFSLVICDILCTKEKRSHLNLLKEKSPKKMASWLLYYSLLNMEIMQQYHLYEPEAHSSDHNTTEKKGIRCPRRKN